MKQSRCDLSWGRASTALAAILLIVGFIAAIVVVSPATTVAQDPTAPPAEGPATIRAVYAFPGGPSIDLLVDGQPIGQNLAFGAASEYAPVAPGTHQVQVVPTGQQADAALTTTEVDAQSGTAYIVTVLGTTNAVEAKVNEVKLEPVGQGQARVRFIHASPDTGSIDVAIAGGDELAGGLDFKSDSDYMEIDAGTYTLELRAADGGELLLSAPDVVFEQGRIYDVVVLGQVADKSLTLLSLVTDVSPSCSQILGIGGPNDACVRFVHTAPDIEAVDFYIGNAVVAEGLTFGQGTNFIAVPASEDQNIQVVATGTTPSEDQSDATQTFQAGYAYQVVVLSADGGDTGATGDNGTDGGADTGNAQGGAGGVQVVVNQLDFTPLPEGQARVRVLHTAADVDAVDVAVANGPTLFEGVTYGGGGSDYRIVAAGPVRLQVRPAGEDVAVLETDVNFEPAMVYDIFIVGRVQDQTLTLLILTAPTTPLTGAVATPAASPTVAPGMPATTPGASPMASPVASPIPSPAA
ncbi:MAG: hypothetical protein QOJ59_645 [Thermomicrobiales bacterium]|jgi:hypothetical protein|nr:hypothetical protein [Thermomicrobiales bacterium]